MVKDQNEPDFIFVVTLMCSYKLLKDRNLLWYSPQLNNILHCKSKSSISNGKNKQKSNLHDSEFSTTTEKQIHN